jgi:hypothetical protein
MRCVIMPGKGGIGWDGLSEDLAAGGLKLRWMDVLGFSGECPRLDRKPVCSDPISASGIEEECDAGRREGL